MRDRSFTALIILVVLIGPAFALCSGGIVSVGPSLIMSLLVFVSAVVYRAKPRTAWVQILLSLLLVSAVLAHYACAGFVTRALSRPRLDDWVMQLDQQVLGWAVPGGQLSLWLDTAPYIGPASDLGRILTEIFQISYFSFYLWGHLLLISLLLRIYVSRHNCVENGSRDWENLKSLLCAWQGVFAVNILCYIVVPVIGPRFYYPSRFQNPLDGLGVAMRINDFIMDKQPFAEDCFPSGHTAMSWVIGLCACKIAPNYARFAMAAALLITLATIYLRYHYVSDLLAAVPLIVLGLAWGKTLKSSPSAGR